MVSFFTVGLLFLLFDLELLWVFPLAPLGLSATSTGGGTAILFFNFIAVSLGYEILSGVIKQT